MSKDGYTQGKCPKCKTAFWFAYPAHLKDAYCPKDGTKLVATSYLYKGTWETVNYAFKSTFKFEKHQS